MSVFVKIISYKNLKDSGLISFDFPVTFSVKKTKYRFINTDKNFFGMEKNLTLVTRAAVVNFASILLKEV